MDTFVINLRKQIKINRIYNVYYYTSPITCIYILYNKYKNRRIMYTKGTIQNEITVFIIAFAYEKNLTSFCSGGHI